MTAKFQLIAFEALILRITLIAYNQLHARLKQIVLISRTKVN